MNLRFSIAQVFVARKQEMSLTKTTTTNLGLGIVKMWQSFSGLEKNPELFIYMNLVGACEAFEQVSIDELATDFEDFAFMSDGDDEMPMGWRN